LTLAEYRSLSARQKRQTDDVIGAMAERPEHDAAWFATHWRGIRENLGFFYGVKLTNPYDPDWDG
jgi:hypothetical protein